MNRLLYAAYWTAGAGITFATAFGWHLAGWGLTNLVVLVLVGWVLWLHLDRVNVHERAGEAVARAGQAVARVEAVENHLTGMEPAGTGRHARPTVVGVPHVRDPEALGSGQEKGPVPATGSGPGTTRTDRPQQGSTTR